jgi:ribosomal protein S27AE
MSRNLSQIVTDLFAKPTGGEDPSSRIKRLREEAKIVIENEDTVFAKLRGLLESFRAIIPDEKQRYLAALKALSTTSKLGPQEIVKAINSQLEELKVLEKGLMPTLPGWRDELKAMEARSQQLKGEMAQLRERIAQLESEERTVLTGIAAREKELELAEKTMKDLFADIEAEVTSIKKKVEEFTAEAPAAQSVPKKEPQKIDVPSEKKVEIPSAPPSVETKFERKCPMCGGRFNLLEFENKWQCYTCAYEESTKDEVQDTNEEKSESMSTLMEIKPSDDRPSSRKKTCPACRKTMYWFPNDKAWRCPSCHYERRI